MNNTEIIRLAVSLAAATVLDAYDHNDDDGDLMVAIRDLEGRLLSQSIWTRFSLLTGVSENEVEQTITDELRGQFVGWLAEYRGWVRDNSGIETAM